MATRLTAALRAFLEGLGEDADNFAAEFDHWKALGPAGEYSNYFFGKDGAYSAPKVNGVPNILRHVHLAPEADQAQLRRWKLAHRRGARKTSDRALVYVSDPYSGHLLIYILNEPDAHAIATMATPHHRTAMLQYAKIADHFLQTGLVIG